MTDEERDTLEKKIFAVKQEISTLNEAIIDIDAPTYIGPGEQLHLTNLQSSLVTRTFELQMLEGQLAQGT